MLFSIRNQIQIRIVEMKMKKIAVLFGGCSTEYEVSLQSAHAILSNINKEQYEVLPIGITREGAWLRYCGELTHLLDDSWWTWKEKCIPTVISPDRLTHGMVEFTEEGIKIISF